MSNIHRDWHYRLGSHFWGGYWQRHLHVRGECDPADCGGCNHACAWPPRGAYPNATQIIPERCHGGGGFPFFG